MKTLIKHSCLIAILLVFAQSASALARVDGEMMPLLQKKVTVNKLFKSADKNKQLLAGTAAWMSIVLGSVASQNITVTTIDAYSNPTCISSLAHSPYSIITGSYPVASGTSNLRLDGSSLYSVIQSTSDNPTSAVCIKLNFSSVSGGTGYYLNEGGSCPLFAITCTSIPAECTLNTLTQTTVAYNSGSTACT